jgi:hypothetical protein
MIYLNNTLTESTEESKYFNFHTFVPNECKTKRKKIDFSFSLNFATDCGLIMKVTNKMQLYRLIYYS